MDRPDIAISRIGNERQPLVTIDGFAPDPDGLRAAAMTAKFVAADEYYPGVRAPLPEGYLRDRMPLIAQAIGRAFGRARRVHVVDASFSIVTTLPANLSIKQRLPHVDAFARERIAMIQYLSPDGSDGTAFFRHRATGYETVDDNRAAGYFAALDSELAQGAPAAGYIVGDGASFERHTLADARYNRTLLYRSYLLHSGAIAPDAALSADPAVRRLTVTGFFAVE